jgi:hypothetical protein
MPVVPARYWLPEDREAQRIDEAADTERKARKKALDTYWRYYGGQHHAPLRDRQSNTIVNLCAQGINKAVAFFLAPDVPTIMLPGETPQPGDESPAQQALTAFWDAIGLDDFLHNIGLAGFVSGHTFVKLLDVDPLPRAALLDARYVTAMWGAHDVSRPLWYRLQWEYKELDEVRRQDVVPAWILPDAPEDEMGRKIPDPEAPWVILEYIQRSNARDRWEEVGRDMWEYPFPPIVQWKNAPLPHTFYGPSDLKHHHLNDQVNFIASNTARIIKFHAHPATFADFNLDNIEESAVDGLYEIPQDGNVFNLEMKGDLRSSLEMYALLRSAFFTEMRVVDWASQKDKVGQLTNFGLRVLYGDQLDLTNTKRGLYGKGLAEISRRALVMMGFADTDMPIVEWQDPIPNDRSEQVKAIAEEQQIGLTSDRTLVTDLGRDYDQEQKRMVQEGSQNTDLLVGMLRRLNESGSFGPDRMRPAR